MKPENCILMMADDDPDDREFVEEAFAESGFTGRFRVVEDGAELISYLKQEGDYTDQKANPQPNLILLDLNMPKIDGYQALEVIKNDPNLRTIPIVVLTTSESQEDISRTYGLGVNSFITKPSGFDNLVKMAEGINQYWLNLVKLPTS